MNPIECGVPKGSELGAILPFISDIASLDIAVKAVSLWTIPVSLGAPQIFALHRTVSNNFIISESWCDFKLLWLNSIVDVFDSVIFLDLI